jgi:hypothetical protein
LMPSASSPTIPSTSTTFTVTVPPGVAAASGRPSRDPWAPTVALPPITTRDTVTPHHHHHHEGGSGSRNSSSAQADVPYREEDVLLSLQLLAYLSKYPHVRQAFYKSRVILGMFHSLFFLRVF